MNSIKAKYERIQKYCWDSGIYSKNNRLWRHGQVIYAICDILRGFEGNIFLRAYNTDEIRYLKMFLPDDIKDRIINIDEELPSMFNLPLKLFPGMRRRVRMNVILNFNRKELSLGKRYVSLLRTCNFSKEYNLYDLLENRGLRFERSWWEDAALMYNDIYDDLVTYERSVTDEEKSDAAKRLFGDYLYIRDFINAKEWYKRIQSMNCDSDGRYCQVWGEFQTLLTMMKVEIQEKKHIIVDWIDALRYDELDRMPRLKKAMEEGVYFERFYSAIPYTSATVRVMFSGKQFIEGRLFRFEHKDFKGSKLMSVLSAHQYDLVMCSPVFCIYPDFKDVNASAYPVQYQRREYMPSTLTQFDALYRLSLRNKSCLAIIHNLCETHCPWMNPISGGRVYKAYKYNGDIEKGTLLRQIAESQMYLDGQLNYYSNYYSNCLAHIYLSDHGQGRDEATFPVIEGLHHIVFGIVGRSINKRRIDNMMSIASFSDIVDAILDDNDNYATNGSNSGKEYVMVQMDDVYSDVKLEQVKDGGDPMLAFHNLQRRGVITRKDAFFRYASGHRFYYVKGDDKNHYNEQKYKERIEMMEALAGDLFIDIYKEKKYMVSRELYAYLNYHMDPANRYV